MAHVFRPRRLREKALLRKMVRETALAVDDLVYPLFIVHGRGRSRAHLVHARPVAAVHRRAR